MRPYTPKRPRYNFSGVVSYDSKRQKELGLRRDRLHECEDLFGRRNKSSSSNSRKGRSSELIAAAFLNECGLNVYVPTLINRGIDLIATDKNNNTYRFEVRSIRIHREKLEDNFVSINPRDRGRTDYYVGVSDFGVCVIFAEDGRPLYVHDYDWAEHEFYTIKQEE